MKKYIIFLAAALMFAACAKEEVNVTGETEFITVELNAATKTQLDGLNTKWSADDAVSVNINGESIGTLTLVEGSTFSGNITKGKSGKATLTYPAGVTSVPTTQTAVAGSFANKSALLEGDTTIEDLRAGNGATLNNKTALLQFQTPVAGNVAFTIGETTYTVKNCAANTTYYACVASTTAKLTARINGYLSNATTAKKTFTENKIYDLKALPAPERFSWGLVGQHQNWTISDPTPMYKVDEGIYACLNISLKADGFKFAKMDGLANWNNKKTTFGAWKKSDGVEYYKFGSEVQYGFWYGDPLYSNNQSQESNIGVTDFTKNYDIYVKVYNSWTDSDADGKGTGIGVKYTIVTSGTKVTYPN